MSTHAEEIAYCTSRIEQSKALALATTSTSARASHDGIAKAYKERLAALTAIQPAASATVGQLVVNQRRDGLAGEKP